MECTGKIIFKAKGQLYRRGAMWTSVPGDPNLRLVHLPGGSTVLSHLRCLLDPIHCMLKLLLEHAKLSERFGVIFFKLFNWVKLYGYQTQLYINFSFSLLDTSTTPTATSTTSTSTAAPAIMKKTLYIDSHTGKKQ